MKKKLSHFFLLFFIISVFFLFLRFFHLDQRIIFDWDQETLSFQVKNIIVNHDILLIGHRATDAMGFYFGPYFEYLFVPFYYRTNLHPNSLLLFIVFINSVFLLIASYVTKKIFNSAIMLGFIFFWAVNPLFITYDTTVWAPILIPLGIMLTWYQLWQLYKNFSVLNFFLLGIILGFFTQIHSLFFPIDLFAGIYVLMMFITTKNYEKIVKKVSMVTVGFLVFFVPLIIFDLRHDFLNFKLLLGYFSHRASGGSRFFESISVLANFLKPLLGINNSWIAGIFYIVMMAVLIFLIRRRKGFYRLFYFSAAMVWFITALIYVRYAERPSEYYFLYLYPIIVLAVLDILYHKNKYLVPLVCLLFFILNVRTLFTITTPSDRGLYAKEQIVLKMKEHMKAQPYFLTYEMPRGLNTGYEYLLGYHGLPPSQDTNNPLIILRLPAHKEDLQINNVGIIIADELKK